MSNLIKCTVSNAISHKGERVERGVTLMLTADEVARYQGHVQVVASEDVTVAKESTPAESSNATAPVDEDKKPSRLSLRKRK